MKIKSVFTARVCFAITIVVYPLAWLSILIAYPINGNDEPQNSATAAVYEYGSDFSLRDTEVFGKNTYLLYLSHENADEQVLVTAEKAPVFPLYRIWASKSVKGMGTASSGFSLQIVDDKIAVESNDLANNINFQTFLILGLGVLWVLWMKETYKWTLKKYDD